MSVKDAIIATLSAEDSRMIRGRTLLQKKLYFLGVLTKEDFGFGPYYYGPYSAAVAEGLGALTSAGFISEEPEPLNAGGPFGEKYRYDYQLTPAAQDYCSVRAREIKPYLEALQRINAHSVAHDARLLAVAAKVHLILVEHGEGSIQDIAERAKEFKWALSQTDITSVIAYLKRLNLVGAKAALHS